VSGTFAYAMSCGCAVISTPIPHAVEALNEGVGILLNGFENPEEFQKAILKLVENKQERIEMGSNGYALTHETTWENIAMKYGFLFATLTDRSEEIRFNYPPIKLDHIKSMSTDYGMLQFSKFSQPDPESGYTLDDNSRALIDMVMYYSLCEDLEALKLASIYLNFITGIQREDGKFDNYKNFDRQLTEQNEEVNLEDSNGRALWSLGFTLSHQEILPIELVIQAKKAWDKAVQHLEKVTSPRSIAYTLKGLYYYYLVYQEDTIKQQIEHLADKLLNHYHINSQEKWCWYEDYMTYANNVIPEAMMYGFLATGNQKYKRIAVVTFDFLLSHYFMKGELSVISNRGWFNKDHKRMSYGEQPIEVSTTIIALDLFYEVTGNVKYKNQLKLAFTWFLGNNHLKQIMYNSVNAASYDGLEDKNVNINQGAESTLCFFKTQMIMKKYETLNYQEQLNTSKVFES